MELVFQKDKDIPNSPSSDMIVSGTIRIPNAESRSLIPLNRYGKSGRKSHRLLQPNYWLAIILFYGCLHRVSFVSFKFVFRRDISSYGSVIGVGKRYRGVFKGCQDCISGWREANIHISIIIAKKVDCVSKKSEENEKMLRRSIFWECKVERTCTSGSRRISRFGGGS